MTKPKCLLVSNHIYYRMHRRPVCGLYGKFDQFARHCDLIRTMNEYWEFHTYGGDQRAIELKFFNPEVVLIVQDLATGTHNDILLRWVPGELDPDNKASIGTVATHLQAIYDERMIVEKQQQPVARALLGVSNEHSWCPDLYCRNVDHRGLWIYRLRDR